MRKMAVLEGTIRDGQLSLWANQMTTAPMLPAAPMIDRVGFERFCRFGAN